MRMRKGKIFSKSKRKWDSEYLCVIGIGLRNFRPGSAKRSENFNLENFFPKEKGRRIRTSNNFVQKKREEKLDLE